MRTSHLLFLVFGTALVLAICREPAGRVAVVIFFSGLIVTVVALVGLMSLFQTIGAFGNARSVLDHVQALGSTVVVTGVCAVVMAAVLRICVGLMDRVVQ